jgi:methionyl-tRNA synthetase
VNADLVGKIVNIASRCAGFITKRHFDGPGSLAWTMRQANCVRRVRQRAATAIAACYEAREYGKAMRQIMALADRANQYIDQEKPWALAKDPAQSARVQAVCSAGIDLFRILATYLAPVLPELATRASAFLRWRLDWVSLHDSLQGHTIDTFTPLMSRIDAERIAAMIEGSKEHTATKSPTARPLPRTHQSQPRSQSRISRRSICASRVSSLQSRWQAPTSCSR